MTTETRSERGRMGRRIWRVGRWILVLGLVAFAARQTFLKPIAVRALEVTRGPVVAEALGTGSIESRQRVEIGFEVTARIAAIDVDQGDTLEAGQRLAAIDDSTFTAEVALARQEVALAESTRSRLAAEIERARAVLKAAGDSLERAGPLLRSGTVSQEAFDSAQERFGVATAELARAEAAALEGEAAVVTARRRLDLANAALERTVVASPFEGVVLRRVREVGDVATPGAPVLELAATDVVWASVWVDEIHLDRLRVDQPARIALRSEPDRPLPGKVARIGREVDRETRELLVDVRFDAPPKTLVFGQRADLWIELERTGDVRRLPARALVVRDGRSGVLIANGGRAEFRAVELGLRGRELVELRSGLEDGEVVLDPSLPGGRRLEAGSRVQLGESAAPGTARDTRSASSSPTGSTGAAGMGQSASGASAIAPPTTEPEATGSTAIGEAAR